MKRACLACPLEVLYVGDGGRGKISESEPFNDRVYGEKVDVILT